MKRRCIALLVGSVSALFLLTGCGPETPKDAVREVVDAIFEGDKETAYEYVSTGDRDDIDDAVEDVEKLSPEAAEILHKRALYVVENELVLIEEGDTLYITLKGYTDRKKRIAGRKDNQWIFTDFQRLMMTCTRW